MAMFNEELEALSPDYIAEAAKRLLPGLSAFAYRIVISILIVLVGLKLISMIKKWSRASFARMKLDTGVSRFLVSCVSVALHGLLIFTVAGQLGVSSASIIALLGSAGIAISLALQGSLTNFAGGVLILLSKPFQVGDYIISRDGEGTVSNIGVIYTTLYTLDNRKITLPNGSLSNSPLVNVTSQENRRVVIQIGISYQADLLLAKQLLRETFEAHPLIVKEPPADVYVEAFADSAVLMTARGYTRTADYWQARCELMEAVKLRLDEAGVEIAYPQVDIHMR